MKSRFGDDVDSDRQLIRSLELAETPPAIAARVGRLTGTCVVFDAASAPDSYCPWEPVIRVTYHDGIWSARYRTKAGARDLWVGDLQHADERAESVHGLAAAVVDLLHRFPPGHNVPSEELCAWKAFGTARLLKNHTTSPPHRLQAFDKLNADVTKTSRLDAGEGIRFWWQQNDLHAGELERLSRRMQIRFPDFKEGGLDVSGTLVERGPQLLYFDVTPPTAFGGGLHVRPMP